jgi:PAS domain S-box-containing protein
MSWVTVLWSMVAAACLTMALPHLIIGLRQRAWVHLLFALAAVAVALVAALELAIMKATTTDEIGYRMQWCHVPIFVLLVCIFGFVRLYFGTGRTWLGVTACVLRFIGLVLNFTMPPTLTHQQITHLRFLDFLGETVAMPGGAANPWRRIGEASSLFLLAFVIDASLTLWRRGNAEERRRAVIVGGSVALFIVVAAGWGALINAQVVHSPYLISLPFLAIVGAMCFELSYDVLRTGEIAQRLRASEAALRESERRANLTAEAASLGMWMREIGHEEMWASEHCRALFGLAPDAVLRHEVLQELIHPDDRMARQTALDQAMQHRVPYDTEYRVLLADGTVRWIASHGRAEFDETGRPVCLLGVCRDITARRQEAHEAQQQREELAHLSRVALMGEMAASLAHELNQPLTGIVNNASAGRRFIAKDRADFPKLDELFAAVVADGQRAGEIIRGIRSMVQKSEEVRRPVDLGAIIADTIRLILADAHARHCTVLAEPAGDLPRVEADAVQIQQVLLNLIINACEAMRDAAPTERRVIIRAERTGGDGVLVSVRDFGQGLPPKNPQRIFERFFSTKREGMGMGLAIARGIIASHGGEMTATNAPGGGACLRFSLPAYREEAV